MGQAVIYALLSVLVVSAISVLSAIPFFITSAMSKKAQLFLLSLSAGSLLGVVFLDFIPEIIEEGYTTITAVFILLGVLVFFLIERLIHNHHSHRLGNEHSAHSHAYHLAPMNLMGDAIHNFIDGMVIGAAYLLNPVIGLTSTISVAFHEIPQEIADFGIVLYAGYTKRKAIFFNLLSSLTAFVGVFAAVMLAGSIESFHTYAIPFAAGTFIYIAAANLLPQLHRHCDLKDSVVHFIAIIAGFSIIYLVSAIGPVH